MDKLNIKNCAVLKPCENCPFRSDVRPFLRTDRAAELVEYTRQGFGFHCHKTTTETGNGKPKQCAGALILARKEDNLYNNQMVRIEARLGADFDEVKETSPVYESGEAMIEAYRKENDKLVDRVNKYLNKRRA